MVLGQTKWQNQGVSDLVLSLVFMDKVLPPMHRGKRPDIGELIVATVDYDHSSADRRELAEKVLYAQLRLAKSGFSTGGRPPYGFRRWLVTEDGKRVRQLVDGEYVKMRGHHVVWLPGPDEEWVVIRRILKMHGNHAGDACREAVDGRGYSDSRSWPIPNRSWGPPYDKWCVASDDDYQHCVQSPLAGPS